MYKLLALFQGFLVSIMVSFNGILANYVGFYNSVFIVHLVGLISIILILILKKEHKNIEEKIPIYLFLGGGIGVFVVLFNIMCFNRLGIAITISLGLLGQSLFSCIIDHFGLFGVKINKFHKNKIIGFLLVLFGICIMTFY
ncbi:DMT family transporter [Tepidibacter formicigenes]|jgi:transporter family-2 protein|uniref:Transporter family-2 protein n=1 Tax=Tepidibacter formicigenes DSM 15518 TaxID=1123349 RepID=A0A1M6NVX2_9FIRM|nr:DMT family transporter [Tepidibacter formicigenes]SHJ99897.1 transporter family-2 protein [Tepidibacter formicigenes DSM 15518]